MKNRPLHVREGRFSWYNKNTMAGFWIGI